MPESDSYITGSTVVARHFKYRTSRPLGTFLILEGETARQLHVEAAEAAGRPQTDNHEGYLLKKRGAEGALFLYFSDGHCSVAASYAEVEDKG